MAGNETKSIEINVSSNLTAGNFVSKIEEMREKLAETRTRNRPVLPTVLDDRDPEIIKKITWFDIILSDGPDGKNKIRLRIRRDKLYLQGFRVNDTGNWFELGVKGKDKPLIDTNSTLLGYSHNYKDLLVAGGFDATGGLTEIIVGREKLISAVDSLANVKAKEKKRAEALLIVIVMFCESARFVPVLGYLRRIWQQKIPEKPEEKRLVRVPEWIDTLVHRWGELSGCVLFYDANPNYKWVPQKLVVEKMINHEWVPKEVEARTVDELLDYLGILQRDPETIHPPKL